MEAEASEAIAYTARVRAEPKRSRRARLVAVFATSAGAAGCLLTTSLDDLSTGESDAGRVDAPADAVADVQAMPDAAREDPCTESTLIICFSFETSTTGAPPGGAVASSVDLVSGSRGRVARFTTSGRSMIRIPASAAWEVSTFTFEAWVSPGRIPAADERFGVVDSEFRAAMFLYPDGRIHCRAGTAEAVTVPIEVDRFTHVACVFDADGIAAYANGELGERRKAPFTVGSGQPTLIGANAPDGGNHFDGLLDDVRVHGVALDAAIIQRHAR